MSDKLILGCGYLGRRVTRLWRAAGHRVFATTRCPAKAEELRRMGLEPILADVLEPHSLEALPPVSSLVFCVGLDRSAGVPMRRVYVEGLANVLAELARSGSSPDRFLYVSSTGVYGQGDGTEVDETAVTEPTDESGRIVLEAERLLRERWPDAIILRFAGLYGPGRLIGARGLSNGEPLTGDPRRWLNLIHVEDGAAAVLAAEERGRPGESYNVGDGHPVARQDFFTCLAGLLGVAPPVFRGHGEEERGNRRIGNRRLREELGLRLRYPSYAEGLPASLAAEES
jgi:nucleoside-diphosphate-sugar epimerase